MALEPNAGRDRGMRRRLGPYTIISELARGGMGQVYLALRDGANEPCVLKELLLELKTHQTAAKRLQREAHLAAYLQHENIARILDAGFVDNVFYLAVELIPGKDLAALIDTLAERGEKLPIEAAVSIALSLLSGLEYAHDARDPAGRRLDVVHRDLSPRNVMLSFDGEVKIIDFGAARGKLDDFRTAPGMFVGTPRYVSPEQAVGREVDRRSDLYTLSILLHEMLTGRPLLTEGSLLEILGQVLHQTPGPVSEHEPRLGPEVDAIIAKGLAKDPAARWQSAGEYRRALAASTRNLRIADKGAIASLVRRLFPGDVGRTQKIAEEARESRTGSTPGSYTASDLYLETKSAVRERPEEALPEPTVMLGAPTVVAIDPTAIFEPTLAERTRPMVTSPLATTEPELQRSRTGWIALAAAAVALGISGLAVSLVSSGEQPEELIEVGPTPVAPAITAAAGEERPANEPPPPSPPTVKEPPRTETAPPAASAQRRRKEPAPAKAVATSPPDERPSRGRPDKAEIQELVRQARDLRRSVVDRKIARAIDEDIIRPIVMAGDEIERSKLDALRKELDVLRKKAP